MPTKKNATKKTTIPSSGEQTFRLLFEHHPILMWIYDLEAGGPEKGLALAAAHEGPLHLLLTDVIMPAMNGRKMYQQLASERAGLKVLYMSGYTDNMIAHHGVLDEGMAFLQKPFTLHSLLPKVRAVLG